MDMDDSRPIGRAVVLAGGKGTRLHPLTFALPKPMLPIGETPIIDIVLAQLEKAGIEHVTIAAGHMVEIIMAYVSSRKERRMKIDFHAEDSPLGTAGSLAFVKDLNEKFLILNGDLLTSMDYRCLAAHHWATLAEITIGAYRKRHQIGLGVLETDTAGNLISYTEKPSRDYLASMGIYVMEPSVIGLIDKGERIDLPDLVTRAGNAGRKVVVYEFSGYWRDIGTPKEYARALEDFRDENPTRKFLLDDKPAK